MPSEAPSRATAASAAAEPVWVAVDFDRACGVRRRGARWRWRAGVFAAPGSTFAGLFAWCYEVEVDGEKLRLTEVRSLIPILYQDQTESRPLSAPWLAFFSSHQHDPYP